MTQLAHNGQLSSEGINREMWIPKSDQVPVQIQLQPASPFLRAQHSAIHSVILTGQISWSQQFHFEVDRITDIADTWWSVRPSRFIWLRVWECGGKILIAALGMRICFVFCVLYFVPASVKCRIRHYMTRISLLFRIILRKFRLSLLHINTLQFMCWGAFSF